MRGCIKCLLKSYTNSRSLSVSLVLTHTQRDRNAKKYGNIIMHVSILACTCPERSQFILQTKTYVKLKLVKSYQFYPIHRIRVNFCIFHKSSCSRHLNGFTIEQSLMMNHMMIRIMRKPVLAICKQQRRRSACASMQSDQYLCCSLPG